VDGGASGSVVWGEEADAKAKAAARDRARNGFLKIMPVFKGKSSGGWAASKRR
jgi:hypothetical protein